MPPQRAVFLDRDGTINTNRPDHVKSLDEFAFLPGALAAIARLAATPLAIIVVSNQSAVNRGLVSEETEYTINQHMLDRVRAHGGRLDAIYICPHTPDEQCPCRKPRPGLLLQAQRDHNLTLAGSYVIGDAVADIELAESMACHPVMVLTGRGASHLAKLSERQRRMTHIAPDLGAAVEWVLSQEEQRLGKQAGSAASPC